jgi:tRNA (guanine-N7-)-methyltransferase
LPERHDSLYGRRKGRPLSPRRAALVASALPRLVVDVKAPRPENIAALFSRPLTRFRVEVGFGGGEHLIAEASREPDTGFIGVEPFANGMAKAVDSVATGGLDNVRLFGGDAAVLLDWLPDASLDHVDLLYPDPWPKKRHWKRRFVSKENLARLARVMKRGASLHVASDIPDYVAWTLMHIADDKHFRWTAECASDWTLPFPAWSGTRYEAKARAAGRVPTYLVIQRI